MPCSSAAAIDLVVAHRAARLDDGERRPPWPPRRRRRGTGRRRRRRPPSPASGARAFDTAMRTESTRDIWPAPMPSVRPPPANTMAFDLTCLQTRQAKSRSAQLVRRSGARLVTTLRAGGGRACRGRASAPGSRPATLRSSSGAGARRGAIAAARAGAGSSWPPAAPAPPARSDGAMTHSRKVSASSRAELAVDRAVDRDDAAERRHRVGLARAAVGLGDARRRDDRDAARVVVLDDRGRRRGELAHEAHAPRRGRGGCCTRAPCPAAPRRAPATARAAPSTRVERRLLVRVLAVAQRARQRRRDRCSVSGKSARRRLGRSTAGRGARRWRRRRRRCARTPCAPARSAWPPTPRPSRRSPRATGA